MRKGDGKVLLETGQFFERQAAEYARDSKAGDELKLALLKELAQAGDSFLDAGCGNGYFTDRALAETNISWACSLDVSQSMLSLNKKLPNKHLCQASVLQMPFKPHSFTFTHFDEVLHHVVGVTRKLSVQQAYDVLRDCVALTKKGGFLLLTERCINPRISSIIIFYALRFLSRTKLARLFHVPSGLLISFLTPNEFLPGIRAAGAHIIRIEVMHTRPPLLDIRNWGLLFRLALCRDHPRIIVLASPICSGC